MSAELIVQLAEVADASAIVQFLQRVRHETDYVVYDQETWTSEQQAKLIAQYQQHPTALMVLAKVEEEVVGLLTLLPLGDEGTSVELGVVVAQAYWGYGIGSELMALGIDFAQESGIERLELEVLKQNQAAQRLYRKFGFEQETELEQTLLYAYHFAK